MPNWCNNNVEFKGNVAPIVEWIKEQDWSHGNLPVEGDRYFFNVEIEDYADDYLQVRMESKWCPPMDEIKRMCEKYGVSATAEYDECGMAMYGAFGFGEKEYHVYLTDEDLNTLSYDDQTDEFVVVATGDRLESEYAYYLCMLDYKLKGL